MELEFSVDDKSAFRKAGVLVPTQLADGSVYISLGGGYTTSGVSIRVVTNSDNHTIAIRQYEDYFRDNLHSLLSMKESDGMKFESEIHLRLIPHRGSLHVIENHSGACWNLNSL